MFLSFFQKQQKITIINKGVVTGEDDFGNDIYETVTTEYDCLVASGNQSASVDGVNLLQSFDMKVFLPIEAVVNANSRIIYEGSEYSLDGLPDYKKSIFDNELVTPKLILKLVRKGYV